MANEVTPTQADQEAAASLILQTLIFQHGGEQPWMDASIASMRMGEQDNHWQVQAFAAHRIAHEAPLLARIAELEKALRGLEPHLDAIVCFASDMDEHEPNRLAVNARAALATKDTSHDA